MVRAPEVPGYFFSYLFDPWFGPNKCVFMQVFGDLVGETETTGNGLTKYTKHVRSHDQLSGGFCWSFVFSLCLFSFPVLVLSHWSQDTGPHCEIPLCLFFRC